MLLQGHNLGATGLLRAGHGLGESAGLPNLAAPILPHIPTMRLHPEYSAVVENGGRVVSATDLEGLANVSEGAAGIGPEVMTDGQGREFWRFSGAEYGDIATTLSCDARDMTVFMVARVPKVGIKNNMFGLGVRNQSTQANTNGTTIDVRSLSNNAGFLYGFGKPGSTAASGKEWMIPGAQKQVIGINSKSGGQRMFINERFADVAVAFNTIGATGAEIGRYPFSPGTSGKWGKFDLYELIVYSPGLTDAEALEVSEALMVDHGITAITNQLVLDGDSITQGTGPVVAALSAGAILTEPGANLIPDNWRVVNYGVSGDEVPDLVARRDAAESWTNQTLPGQNVMAFEIGRNDWPPLGGNQTAQQHYDNVVAYLNTATDGVLQKGWSVRVMANIASAASLMPQITAHRAALRDPQFLTDTGSTGEVSIISTDLIEHNGETRFADNADAANLTYYVGDNTHPNVLGAEIRMTGGDTPEYGVAYGLLDDLPTWAQFSTNAWLQRSGNLDGAPATTQSVLAQVTYSPDAAAIGEIEDLLNCFASTNSIIRLYKGANDQVSVIMKDNTNTTAYIGIASGALVAGGEYSIILSVDCESNGLNLTIIDLADGSVFGTLENTNTGFTFDGTSASLWLIGAGNGSGIRETLSRLERVMLWMNAAPDVSTTPVQRYFTEETGALRGTADVVTSVGAAPIINISGAELITGANAGSGGDFAKAGAGTITASS